MGLDPIMQFFTFAHLPEKLQVVSEPFGELARHMVDVLPNNPEREAALRKLLEAKDAAVRAQLFKEGDVKVTTHALPDPRPTAR